MKFTYLLINFFTVIVPFIFSFHPKLNFYKTWRSFFPAVVLTAMIFIIWDIYFTSIGVWGFNKQYLTGIYVANLPIEEVLFFFCIPYACVFTYHCLDLVLVNALSYKTENRITNSCILIFLAFGIWNYDKVYPLVTFTGLSALLFLSRHLLRVSWLANFYVVYGVLLLPFLIVNGLLTGSFLENPVVWYDADRIFGLRIFTIPIEDVFYGMALILVNLLIYQFLSCCYDIRAEDKEFEDKIGIDMER